MLGQQSKTKAVRTLSWTQRIKDLGIDFDSHIRLFAHEGAMLMDNDDFQHLLNKYVQDRDVRVQFEKFVLIDDYKVKRKLFKVVSYHGIPHDPDANTKALNSLVRIIVKSNDKSVIEILKLENVYTDYYQKFYACPLDKNRDPNKMDRISMMLYPEPIINYLKTINVNVYHALIDKVDRLISSRNSPAAACEILRSLSYCSDDRRGGDAYHDFIEACLEDPDGYNNTIPLYIDSNYFEGLAEFKARKTADSKVFVPNEADMIDPEIVYDDPRPQSQYMHFRQLYTEFQMDSDEVLLRPYQVELGNQAVNGRNTIICAPTGSGKTHVVTNIIKSHLELCKRDGKVARVVMLVPTIPLVDQQTQYFLRFLLEKYWVDGISGVENTEDRAGHLLACDVVVMTPQVLVNMISSIIRKDKVYFTDFTLIILDECHHSREKHPYKILMDMLAANIAEGKVRNPPQIVGLTASLGVGQTSWNIEACRKHILELCSNLRAESISTVRHQIDDLNKYVRPTVDIVERVNRSADDKMSKALSSSIKEIEMQINPLLHEIVNSNQIPLKPEEIEFPDHDSQWAKYENFIGNINTHIARQRIPDNKKIPLSLQIQHLSYYFRAVRMNEVLPQKYAMDYLASKIKVFLGNHGDGENFGPVQNFLRKVHENLTNVINSSQPSNKPILSSLYNILKDQFSSNPQSRCLIFVSTRSCAKNLSDHLTEVKELEMFYGKKDTISFMVSSNQTSMAGGQSAREQQEIQDKFKEGRIKVLVVTSVAEEGINIAECNLIIKYNSVGSERTLIQRRGRARAMNSKSILLALDNSVEQQEFQNMRKEALMFQCIRDLQEYDDESLRKMIIERKNELEKRREEEIRREQERSKALKAQKYILRCKSCDNWISHSYDVRIVATSYFVCCDPTIWSRSKFLYIRRPTKQDMTTLCAKLTCTNCAQEWGQVIKYSNVFLPSLMANAFVMERQGNLHFISTQDEQRVKTWRRIRDEFFNIEPLTIQNMKAMYDSLLASSKEEYEKMAKQEEIANLDLIEKIRKYNEKMRVRRQNLRMEE